MTVEPLVRYDAMVGAIAECHRVDEVQEIRNQAIALFPDLQEFYPVKRGARHVYVRRDLLTTLERSQIVSLYRRLAAKYNRKADALEAEGQQGELVA